MRVVHVVDSMQVGGAEVLVAQLCRHQRENGYTPKVCCLFGGGPLADGLTRAGFAVSILNARGPVQRMAALRKELRGHEVAHCHNAGPAILGAAAARMAGVRRVVVTRHGMVAPGQNRRQEVKFWIAARLFCDRVVAVCETAHRNLEAGPLADARKITTIYNGTLPAPGGSAPAWSGAGFRLIHVGRLNEVKDQRTLLKAVALAQAEVPDIRLTMVGGGALREELERLTGELGISDCVVFLGERHDTGTWLAQSDVFILSSRTEGLPMSLLEAIAAGVPQIVTDVGGMPEILRMSQAGIIVPPNSAGELTRAIVEMSARRGTLRELGERARACYEERFTLARMGQEYDRLYRDMQ